MESEDTPQGSENQETLERAGGAVDDFSAREGSEGAEEAPALSPEEQVIAERDKLKEQLLRTAADFDNFRKRTRRDVQDANRRGVEDTLREVLPVIDNLERAVTAAGQATEVASVAEGVRMVLRQFEEIAARMQLARIPTVGERFDPAVHDAVQQVPSAEHAPGTVIMEVMPGYAVGERLLRPAVVVVASANVEGSGGDSEPHGDDLDAEVEGEGSTEGGEDSDDDILVVDDGPDEKE